MSIEGHFHSSSYIYVSSWLLQRELTFHKQCVKKAYPLQAKSIRSHSVFGKSCKKRDKIAMALKLDLTQRHGHSKITRLAIVLESHWPRQASYPSKAEPISSYSYIVTMHRIIHFLLCLHTIHKLKWVLKDAKQSYLQLQSFSHFLIIDKIAT